MCFLGFIILADGLANMGRGAAETVLQLGFHNLFKGNAKLKRSLRLSQPPF